MIKYRNLFPKAIILSNEDTMKKILIKIRKKT